jgi:hypothetical protein
MAWTRFLGASLLLAIVAGCADTERCVPPELVGEWETRDPRYGLSALRLTEDRVVFRNAEGVRGMSGAVTAVDKAVEEGRAMYRIHYRPSDGGMGRSLSLYFEPAPDGDVVRLKNRPGVEWKRRSAPHGGLPAQGVERVAVPPRP